MTKEEMIDSMASMLTFIQELEPEEFQEFFDTLELDQQELLMDLFRDYLKIRAANMSPTEQEKFNRELLIHLPHLRSH
jgi:hypothetical protein